MKKETSKKMPVTFSAEGLRSKGFMTIDEFVNKLTPAISEHLHKTWGHNTNDLHHPEDLMVNASVFIDAALIVTAHFTLGDTNERNS